MKKIQTGDTVMVIAGKDKGTVSTVVDVTDTHVLVKGVNTVKKSQKGQGFVEIDKPVDLSNVQPYDKKAKQSSKVGIKEEKGKKVRYYKKSGNTVLSN